MTIREIRKIKWDGKNQFIKVDENLYVEVTKTKKVFKVLFKKQGKQIKATLDNVDNITLTEAKQKILKLKSKIADKDFEQAREIVRAELAKKQSKKDKQIIQKKIAENEKYLLKNLMADFLQTRTNQKEINRINTYILPLLGNSDVRTLKTKDIFEFFKKVKKTNNTNVKATRTKNKIETAKKLRQTLNVFFKYIAKKYEITNNPIILIENKDLEGIFGKESVEHQKAILNIDELQTLYKKIYELEIKEQTKNARNISIYTKNLMRFLMLTALRIGTAKKLKWEYVDWENKIINIPAEITKTNIKFRLPLANETLNILNELKQYTKTQKGLIFVNNYGGELSENTINKHLRKLSSGKTTSHGFRSSFSTILKEKGENYLYIETQLMHAVESKVTKAYTRTDYLQQRKQLLQKWEDLLTAKIKKPTYIKFDY